MLLEVIYNTIFSLVNRVYLVAVMEILGISFSSNVWLLGKMMIMMVSQELKGEEAGGTDDHLGEESRLITSLKLAGCVKRLSLNGSWACLSQVSSRLEVSIA